MKKILLDSNLTINNDESEKANFFLFQKIKKIYGNSVKVLLFRDLKHKKKTPLE